MDVRSSSVYFSRHDEDENSLFKQSLAGYTPSVKIELNTNRFSIRTARNSQDLLEALLLRHQVFYQELLNTRHPMGIDLDRYDTSFDHILLSEHETGKVIGTYRLNCSSFNSFCYSESEFDCQNFQKLPGVRLELGRACLHPQFRSGAHFILLWRGILAYAQATNSRYMYGCASVKTTDQKALTVIYKELSESYGCHSKWHIYPKPEFALPDFSRQVKNLTVPSDCEDPLGHVPSLLWFYFKAGARICGEPAIDSAFKCADFPVILDIEEALHPLKQRIAG